MAYRSLSFEQQTTIKSIIFVYSRRFMSLRLFMYFQLMCDGLNGTIEQYYAAYLFTMRKNIVNTLKKKGINVTTLSNKRTKANYEIYITDRKIN